MTIQTGPVQEYGDGPHVAPMFDQRDARVDVQIWYPYTEDTDKFSALILPERPVEPGVFKITLEGGNWTVTTRGDEVDDQGRWIVESDDRPPRQASGSSPGA